MEDGTRRWVVRAVTGRCLGRWDGDRPEDAVDAMYCAAGYDGTADYARRVQQPVEEVHAELVCTLVRRWGISLGSVYLGSCEGETEADALGELLRRATTGPSAHVVLEEADLGRGPRAMRAADLLGLSVTEVAW